MHPQSTEWSADLPEPDRSALHPSMQRLSTAEIRVKLANAHLEYEDDKRFPPSPDRRELLESDRRRIAALERALELRETAP